MSTQPNHDPERTSSDERKEYFKLQTRSYYRARAVYDQFRFLRPLRRLDTRLSPGIRILGYHRIAKGDALCVEPDAFRRQLNTALERGAVPISLTNALDLLESGTPLDEPLLVVTFDDGYLDNLETGLPILEEFAVPATIFLVSGIAGGRDPYHWYRQDPPPAISWSDARALAEHSLIEFQAHGRQHKRLTALTDVDAHDEISGAKEEIERELETVVSTFCYPAGLFGEREVQILREAGYRGATSNISGVNQTGADLFRLKRLMIMWSDNHRRFNLRLNGAIGESRLEGWVRRRRRFSDRAAASEGIS